MNFCIIFCFLFLFLAHMGLPFKANPHAGVWKLICYHGDRAFCPSLSFPVIFTIPVELCMLAGSSAVRRWWRQITTHASLITHISISVEFEPPTTTQTPHCLQVSLSQCSSVPPGHSLETCDTRNQPFSHLHRQVWHLSSYSRSEEDILACSVIFHFWLKLYVCLMLLSDVHVFLLSNLKLLQQPPAKVNILSARGGNGGKVWLFQKIANHHLKWLVRHCVASKNWCNC